MGGFFGNTGGGESLIKAYGKILADGSFDSSTSHAGMSVSLNAQVFTIDVTEAGFTMWPVVMINLIRTGDANAAWYFTISDPDIPTFNVSIFEPGVGPQVLGFYIACIGE